MPSLQSTMIQSDIQLLSYFGAPNNPSIFPANLGLNHGHSPPLQLTAFPNYPIIPSNFPYISSTNSTSEEAEDPQLIVADERRRRRMISNRESSRRSRMRKQRQLYELCSQAARLAAENHSLVEEMNRVWESHDRVVRENVKLREEASDLRRMLVDLQAENSSDILRDIT